MSIPMLQPELETYVHSFNGHATPDSTGSKPYTIEDLVKKPMRNTYGAPPKDLGKQGRSAITDFFTAAEFEPVLTEKFLAKYRDKQPAWGPIGYVTYKRTYARPLYSSDFGIGLPKDDRDPIRNEEFWETLLRVINGMWHTIRCHSARKHIHFDEEIAQRKAQAMFIRMWDFKWLPPGRGLWMMGARPYYLKGSAAANNCGFVSTKNIDKEGSESFVWAMDMSMLGVGVGFDVLGADKLQIKTPQADPDIYIVPDTREGWVDSVKVILDAFFEGAGLPVSFDYSLVRVKGVPIRGFGGVAEGPEHLKICHEKLIMFLTTRVGKYLTSSDIVDIFNMIGACVVSGNVRRSAQISLGMAEDEDFISLKHDPKSHPDCWNSNNSVLATVGMDYTRIAELITTHGEPGLFWLDNARAFSRMGEPATHKDKNAVGTNPCSEQTLHDKELCCLVENFPSRHIDETDFQKTLKQSYLYAKTVTLVPCHNKKTNAVMGKNSRIGCSLSGLQDARMKFGTRTLLRMLDRGYTFIQERDQNYSDWLQVRKSIKTTSIKPSGTVSLLPGVKAGLHRAIAKYKFKNMRFSKTNAMLPVLEKAGYRIFPASEQPDTTVCVAFPVKEEYMDMTEGESANNIWEQLEFCAQIQEVWSDNQNSITVKFKQKPGIDLEIKAALEMYETRLKCVSFLPHWEPGDAAAYQDMPEQPIDEETYLAAVKSLKPFTFSNFVDDLYDDPCATGQCPVR